MYLTQKQKVARNRKIERKRGQAEGMAKINDWKRRKAVEEFHRPAFQGTELESKND